MAIPKMPVKIFYSNGSEPQILVIMNRKYNAVKAVWLFSFLVFLLMQCQNQTAKSPHGLMVEFIREADRIKILDAKPEFSWIVPEKAGCQTAFQVLVSSSKGSLAKNEADAWDSGRITGSLSSEVEFAGAGLPDNSSFFWKVRIWDKRGKPSSWSEIKSFKTGSTGSYATTGNKFIATLSRPGKLIKTGEDRFFADFGKDAFGTLIIEITPVSHDTLIIHFGEKAKGMNEIDTNPGGTIRYQKVFLPVDPEHTKYTVNLLRDERNTGPAAIQLPDSFGIITPFRYCLIENCDLELKPQNLIRKAYWYYFDDLCGSFESSDTTLNRIWELCKYSMKATSFAGIYVDGDRERIPYEADAYINQLGHYCTDREYSLARRTNEYFISHPTWPTEWILQTIPLFFNDVMYTGNIESVSRYYSELQHKTLIALSREDGLISSTGATGEVMKELGFSDAKERIRDIIDWPPSQKDTGWKLATAEGERDGYEMVEVNTVVNAFHYNNLLLMAELAGLLGKDSDSLFYLHRAETVKSAFNKVFLEQNRGYYVDGEKSSHSSLHANMMALAFDLVPAENKKAVVEFIKSRGMACSVYGAQYLLEGLYRAGEADYAFSLLTAIHDRSWWNMIKSGTTITMEAWDIKYKPNSDWNHAWGAAPANIIPSCLWGISPVRPGFSKAVIRPQLSKLTYSKIRVPTIRGPIDAEFKNKSGKKEYHVTIPANMECDFVLSGVNNLTILVNGKKNKPDTGIIKLKSGTNTIAFYP